MQPPFGNLVLVQMIVSQQVRLCIFQCVASAAHFFIIWKEGITMFNYPGEKLKFVSRFLFILCIIGTIVLAFSLGITTDRWGDNEFQGIIFFSVLIGGSILSYISSLILYAFGEAVDTLSEIHHDTENISAQQSNSTRGNAPAASTASTQHPQTGTFNLNDYI